MLAQVGAAAEHSQAELTAMLKEREAAHEVEMDELRQSHNEQAGEITMLRVKLDAAQQERDRKQAADKEEEQKEVLALAKRAMFRAWRAQWHEARADATLARADALADAAQNGLGKQRDEAENAAAVSENRDAAHAAATALSAAHRERVDMLSLARDEAKRRVWSTSGRMTSARLRGPQPRRHTQTPRTLLCSSVSKWRR